MAPVAKEAGFSRKGRVFRLATDNGDHALLEFRSRRIDPVMEVFVARVFIVPAASWGWVSRSNWESDRKKAPDASASFLQWGVMPPEHIAFDPHDVNSSDREWAYGARIDPDVAGRAMAEILREETFPTMRRLLDRDELWAEINRPSFRFHRERPPGWARMILRVDEASPAELEELTGHVEMDYPVADEFIAWARSRAAGCTG